MKSEGIGDQLTQDTKESGYECNCVRLEVGAPNVEKWSRMFSSYKQNDFKEVGPRLKCGLYNL